MIRYASWDNTFRSSLALCLWVPRVDISDADGLRDALDAAYADIRERFIREALTWKAETESIWAFVVPANTEE